MIKILYNVFILWLVCLNKMNGGDLKILILIIFCMVIVIIFNKLYIKVNVSIVKGIVFLMRCELS